MSLFIDALTTEDSVTENGMITHSTTSNFCLDFFFSISTFRKKSEDDIIQMFSKAFNEHSETALKLLFWARDIRGGQGERRLFRVILTYLSKNHPNILTNLLIYISEFGRWDDLIYLYEHSDNSVIKMKCIDIIRDALNNNNGLCAKWLPRKGFLSKNIRTDLELSPKAYRKLLVNLTNVVETNMCENTWNTIEYKHVPSVALTRYKNTFFKHDKERFHSYIEDLVSGKTTVNTGAIYPYDIIHSLFNSSDSSTRTLCDEQWKQLPNYLDNKDIRVLPVVDTSGSMQTPVSGTVTAFTIALSLGIYISERNIGPFKDYFITFSENPRLQKLKGSLDDKMNQLCKCEWGMNTNIEKVFDLILTQSIKNNVPNTELPTHILILSDMEFDEASNGTTAYDMITNKYHQSGYTLPNIIFWNLNSRTKNFPVKFDQNGVALVSGFSPTLLKTVLSANIDPLTIMNDTIYTERYKNIKIS